MFNNMNGNTCGCMEPKNCCEVVQTYNVVEVPHYTNYHTHQINNCIKKHINIPVYSTSYENVYIDEYVNANPIYQQPIYQQPMYQGYGYPNYQGLNPNEYQGNVGTNTGNFNPNLNM